MLRSVGPGMMCGCGLVDMAYCERSELNCEAVKVSPDLATASDDLNDPADDVAADIRMETTAPLGDLTEHSPHGRTVVETDEPMTATEVLMSHGAIKYDAGKPRFDLMPPDALTEIAKVYTMGAEKYEARNWEKGTNWGRTNAAMLRHLMAWMACEDNDPESGLNHMAHVAWGAMCLLAYQMRGVGEDDRYAPNQTEMNFSAIKEAKSEDSDI